MRETGYHDHLESALEHVCALGISKLRTPFLLERSTAGQDCDAGWAWHDRQMEIVRRLGITPIAGLLHHGSGPAGCSLLNDALPARLASHAASVSRRYPDIETWTVVNEPLTTARFACLYGIWYPHHAQEPAFLRALANQCQAILLAMREIRRNVSAARFMHTEDLGRVFSTRKLAYQADYENERRWLSLDLLCGRVDHAHGWWERFAKAGVSEHALAALATGEAAPDLIGINHYVTSDRFLDHRLELYGTHLHGGNGVEAYADTEAVRVDLDAGLTGWEARLSEAWARYAVPLVLSEVQLSCTDPHEQVRWLMEAWRAANTLRAKGADIRAAVAWAIFGLVDWSSMLCENRGDREIGPISLLAESEGNPLMRSAIAALAREGDFEHRELLSSGWWRRDERVHMALRA